MNIKAYFWNAAGQNPKPSMPILSFPAVQKMNISLRQLLRSGAYQAEAMRIVAENVPMPASVSPMDLSVEAEAFGARTHYTEQEVPTVLGALVQSREDADALRVPKIGEGRTGICLETIRLAREAMPKQPILAGIIGPYSLAGRLCDVTEIMYICFDEPELAHTVLRKATEFLTEYCHAFKNAGADGVILAEPLAGLLSPEMCGEFSVPYVRRLIEDAQTDDFAVIYHNCGNAVIHMLDKLYAQGAAAYHFGNAVSMREILDKTPEDILCMGNIDPAEFANGTPESITRVTKRLLAECGNARNFLPSSGCDIPPHAKWENIYAYFEALKA